MLAQPAVLPSQENPSSYKTNQNQNHILSLANRSLDTYNQSNDFLTYEYPNLGITLEYPSEWSTQAEGGNITFVSPQENSSDSYQENVNIDKKWSWGIEESVFV